jgi:DNA-binding XRE family transcriptional regulator
MPEMAVTLTRQVLIKFEKDSGRKTGEARGRDGAVGAFPTLSRSQIAKDTGLSKSGVARMFRGDRWPSHQTAEKIAKVLELKLSDFLQELSDARDRYTARNGERSSDRIAK